MRVARSRGSILDVPSAGGRGSAVLVARNRSWCESMRSNRCEARAPCDDCTLAVRLRRSRGDVDTFRLSPTPRAACPHVAPVMVLAPMLRPTCVTPILGIAPEFPWTHVTSSGLDHTRSQVDEYSGAGEVGNEMGGKVNEKSSTACGWSSWSRRRIPSVDEGPGLATASCNEDIVVVEQPHLGHGPDGQVVFSRRRDVLPGLS